MALSLSARTLKGVWCGSGVSTRRLCCPLRQHLGQPSVLFPTLQGKGALADKLECSEGETGRKKESFLQALPDLAAWRERVLEKCRETLFVEVFVCGVSDSGGICL